MITYYSCGCVQKGDVPGTSKCDTHNGFPISNANMVTRARVRKGKDNITYCLANLINVMRVEKDIDLIVLGSSLSIFFRYSLMTYSGARETECMYLKHIADTKTPAVCFVQAGELPVVLYQCYMLETTFNICRTSFNGNVEYAVFINVPAARGASLEHLLMRTVESPEKVLVSGYHPSAVRSAFSQANIVHVTEFEYEFRR